MNAEFQRIARREKKAFLSDQCKEIVENNRMGKTRDLKKVSNNKGTFHAKMSTIKDRKGMDLTEAEGKGKKERYTHLNAEFQRIARRDKKAFLSNQCEEIEENSRMGKTRDLFKKIRDINRTCHAKIGTIKNRNGIDPTEA